MSSAWHRRAGPAATRASRPGGAACGRACARRRRPARTARMSTAAASPSGAADDVQAVVHAVDEVDVGAAGRPEHDARAGGPPRARVAGAILRTAVGLRLDDATDAQSGAIVAHDERPQQAPAPRRWPRQPGPPCRPARTVSRLWVAIWWESRPRVARSGSNHDLADIRRQDRPKDGAEERDELVRDGAADRRIDQGLVQLGRPVRPAGRVHEGLATAVEGGQAR